MMPITVPSQSRLLLSAVVTLLVWFECSNLWAAPDSSLLSKENKLKAAYLLNFTKYIEWPMPEPASRPSPIRICLQDGAPFEAFLRDLTANRVVGASKRRIEVLSVSRAQRCDLTYLYSTPVQPSLKVAESVTVLDSAQVIYEWPTITFYIDSRRLRFEINVQRAKELQVSVSSELLKLGRVR